MTAINKLGPTLREILAIFKERGGGASAQFLSERLGIAQPSVRLAIGRLRAAGYVITYGVETSCNGRKLYGWEKSPVNPRPVAVSQGDGYAGDIEDELGLDENYADDLQDD